MQRKIIQAFFATPSPGDLDRTMGFIYAVCDDGSFWRKSDGPNTPWFREPTIPEGYDNFVTAKPAAFEGTKVDFVEEAREPVVHSKTRPPEKKVVRSNSRHT